jgi:antitoxin HigA-1
MKNPPHLGSLMPHDCISPLGLSITDAAIALGVSRNSLRELVNARRGISPEMAVRLSKAFGGSAESWLTQQLHYDLAQVRYEDDQGGTDKGGVRGQRESALVFSS